MYCVPGVLVGPWGGEHAIVVAVKGRMPCAWLHVLSLSHCANRQRCFSWHVSLLLEGSVGRRTWVGSLHCLGFVLWHRSQQGLGKGKHMEGQVGVVPIAPCLRGLRLGG